VLQEIMATPIDAIVVVVPSAPKLLQTLDEVLPLIEATLKNQPLPTPVPTATATPSVTPSTAPTPNPVFTPVRLLIKPGRDLTIARDTSLRVWVAGVDAFGNQQPVTPTWTIGSSSGRGNMGPDGLFTPDSSGDFTFTAGYGSLTETVTIHVTDADLRELEIVPESDFSLNVGQNFEFNAKGVDEKGRDVIVTPAWSLSNTFVGTINVNGVFTPLQSGRIDVTARAREFVSTRTINVESSSAFLIEVAPNTPVILPGHLQPIQVLGLDFTNNTASSAFSFSVSDPTIGAFLSQDTSINGIQPTAIFQANKVGTTQVTVKDVISNHTTTFPITVAEGVPYISGISPANTALLPGQTVTLTGENFSASALSNQVLFNNLAGSVISATPNSLTVTVPIGAFTGLVTVVTNGQRGSSFPFVITPQLDNIIPSEGDEGDLVTITGDHFSTDNPAHNAVFFDSERASVPINVTNSSMQVRVPANLDEDVQVSVRVKGQLSNFREFTVAGASVPTWTEEEEAPTSRSGAMAEVIDGDIYVIGGYDSGTSDRLEIYDVNDDSWSSGEDLPDESSNLTTAVLDDELYVVGGNGNSENVYRYDPDNDDWDLLDFDTETAHVGAVMEASGGRLYIIGGEGSDGRVVEECDPDETEDDACEVKQNSPTRRFEAASALYNGKIYVIGGGEDSTEDRITAYDIDEDEWITGLTPMPQPLRRARATLINGKIYVVGGEDENGRESDAVYEYSPSGDSWRTLKHLPSARSGPAVAAISSRLYVIGGDSSGGDSQSTNFKGQL
ncbi:MAG TPA: kelch repeat-containing protein, partial [Candidatus Obscuribacterales bacterium]